MENQPITTIHGYPLDYLRSLPDGSLTQQEVAVLCNEIERLTLVIREVADHFDPMGAANQLRGWREIEADLVQYRTTPNSSSHTEDAR